MRKTTLALLLALGLGCITPSQARKEHLLPIPHQITAGTGTYALAKGSAVTVAGIEGNAALTAFFKEFGIDNVTYTKDATAGTVKVQLVPSIEGAHHYTLTGFEANEAYTLKITTAGIEITAVDPIGVTRAAQTLTQLAEGYETEGVNLECLTITDWAAFKLRGFMHDVGRSFLSVDELKKEIRLLSRFKVNTFHWHLTDKTGWRFEVKAYPQLTSKQKRYDGQWYTQEQCKDVVAYAKEHGITVIPEIDMPGHSAPFTENMGFNMQSDQGVEALKKILDETCEVFADCPLIHIGGDEVTITYPQFLETMSAYVRSKGKKVLMWNPLVGRTPNKDICDMTQMWSTSGKVISGLPNIDCRYNYTNHFDVYADLVGIYKSSIYYADKGTPEIAGTISAAWNDTKVKTEEDIVRQNNIYANIIACCVRGWTGGGKEYIEKGGVSLPNSGEVYDDFADFERRFLYHKAHALADAPISYVRQSNVRWRITDPFPNGGDKAHVLPPETSEASILPDAFTYEGQTYGTQMATGAGIYLRHIWHPTVPSFFTAPANNQTAYAWTYVYSPTEQAVGAQIEFYTYSRSGTDKAPAPGAWDRRGSKVWLNGVEIAAPAWEQTDVQIPQDDAVKELKNENLTARPVVQLTLKQGWNKVFMRLPHVNTGGTARDKWQFTFVFTDTEGKNAVEGLIYSPNQCLDANAEQVAAKISEVRTYRRAIIQDMPGYYPESLAADFDRIVAEIEATLGQEMTVEKRTEQIAELEQAKAALESASATAELIQPKASTEDKTYLYTLSTPLRGSKYATSGGSGAALTGQTATGQTAYWRFVNRTDGKYDIVNFADGTYISPASDNNKPLTTVSTQPSAGWTLSASDQVGYFIITSGTVQFNQSNQTNVLNWGDGTNRSDAGCKYRIAPVNLDLSLLEAIPVAGKSYFFYSKHQAGDKFFYDANSTIGFSAQCDKENDAYVWLCESGSNGRLCFKNKATSKYFAWKELTNSPYGWLVSSDLGAVGVGGVINKGCVTLTGEGTGSKVLVAKSNMFDQSSRAGYYDGTFSSDFAFVDYDIATAIPALPAETTAANVYYDLSGRRVANPRKGLYIHNGRKVMLP